MTDVTTPEDLITPDHEFKMRNIRHGVLAPKVAAERWQALQAVVSEMDRLRELFDKRTEAAEDARLEAVALNARAAESGKAVPSGTAVKVMDARLAVDGTLSAFRASLPRLEIARRSYDALFDDRAFIADYRAAVASEFIARRAAAVKAFKELDSQIPALAELYRLLGDFTLNGLLGDTVKGIEFDGKPLTDGAVFADYQSAWTAPKLSEALSEARRYVLNEDPVKGGTLLTEDLDTIADALPELAEQRYDEWQEALARDRMQMRNAGPYGALVH